MMAAHDGNQKYRDLSFFPQNDRLISTHDAK